MDDRLVEQLAATRTIEITTTGRRTGRPVRTEIWWFHFEGRFLITGTPGTRDWLANLRADPRMTVHALDREFSATVTPITDQAFRRRFFACSGPEIDWYLSQAALEDFINEAPMVEVFITL